MERVNGLQNEVQANPHTDPTGADHLLDDWIPGTHPARYLCERCNRIVGEEILSCPDRPQGHCPYKLRGLVPFNDRVISAVILFVSILIILFLPPLLQSQSVWLRLFSGTITSLTFFASLWRTFSSRTLLYNPILRLRWKQTAFLGITLQRILTPGSYPLHLDLIFPRSLHFPPSVTKFSEGALKDWTLIHAVLVFRAAFIGLLARRVVQIQVYPIYGARWWGNFKRDQIVYVLTATEGFNLSSIYGELERQIVLVVKTWVYGSGEEVQEWPDGPPIYHLVRAVFGKDVSSPSGWVFDLVARDAVAHGWGRLRRWPWKRYLPIPTYDVQLQSELATINRLSSWLTQQQPDFSKALDDQIERAIRSRQRQRDYGPYT